MKYYYNEVKNVLAELITKVELKIIETPARQFMQKNELEITLDTLVRALDVLESITEKQFLQMIKTKDQERKQPTQPKIIQLNLLP